MNTIKMPEEINHPAPLLAQREPGRLGTGGSSMAES